MSPTRGEEIRGRFPPAGDVDRAAVLRFVTEAPLRYGQWKHLKALYKAAEGSSEAEILGTLIGRLDAESLGGAAREAQGASGFRFPGEARAAVLAGSTLFVAGGVNRTAGGWSYGAALARRGGGDLHVIDLSDPAAPRRVGGAGIREVQALAAHGELLYAAGEGLQVLDISEPRRPRIIGSLEGVRIRRIFAAGQHLVGLGEDARSRTGLFVIDGTDPTRPREAAFLELPGARDLAVAGRFAYVAEEGRRGGWFGLRAAGGLRVIDLSDMQRPRSVSEAAVAGAETILISGSYAYVAAREPRRGTTTLQVFHLFTPATPRPAGSVALPRLPGIPGLRWGMAARVPVLFVAHPHMGVRVVNVSNPTRPVVSATLPIYGAAAMALLDSLLCVAGSFGGELSLFDVSEPAKPLRLGTPPSAATFRYMKRRARRLLRHLGREEPDTFVKVAYHALASAGRLRPGLEPAYQWVSIDLLYGGSGRYAQASHGEGGCYPRWHRRLRRTREERAPEAWDRRPDLAQRLLAAPVLPWQTREAALKILRAGRVPLPSLPAEALGAMLASPAALLVIAAAREAARQIAAAIDLGPEVAAAVFFASSGRSRRRLAEHWSGRTMEAEWEARFAAALCRLVGERIAAGVSSRRVLAAATLLAGRFAGALAGDALIATAVALLAAEEAAAQALAASLLATASPGAAPEWLAALARLPAERRVAALERLIEALRGQAIDPLAARRLVLAESAWEREAGWQLLAALPAPAALLAALWQELLGLEGLPPALRTALHSAAALETLRAARAVEPELGDRLAERALRAELLTAELLGDVARVAPGELLVRMVAEASAADWERLHDPLLAALEASGRLTAFWQAAWPALEEDAGGVLNQRLLRDARVTDTFLEVEGTTFLESRYPAVGELLLLWLAERQEQFVRDSLELLAAATAPLPAVRAWGLERVRALGMELPFALRLLESGLPDAGEAGRAFFEALPPESEEAPEYALALCDSPEAAVRAYGREYVRQRWSALPRAELLRRLSESADPVMQEFVAGLLISHPELAAEAAAFDRAVLRTRDRGRRAKERVKQRWEQVSPEEIPLLLEIARGRAAAGPDRDAEWALGRLARLALEGHEIEGFALDGPAGG